MPILIDILDNKVLGREYKRGLREGQLKGELTVLRRLMEKRFRAVPSWAEERLVLDAGSLEDLLK